MRIGDHHYSQHTRNIRNFRRGLSKPAELDGPANGASSITTDQSETETTDNEFVLVDMDSSSMPSDSDQAIVEPTAVVVDTAVAIGSGVVSFSDIGSELDDRLSVSDDDGNETIEVNLGIELISQLEGSFGVHAYPLLGGNQTNVFMPKRMARELYALWIESLYNQQDEQRQRAILEDEEFALQLQAQQQKELDDAASAEAAEKLLTVKGAVEASSSVTSPAAKVRPNMKQIVEMECAWAEYQRQQTTNQWQAPAGNCVSSGGVGVIGGQGLAAELTQHKLNELFPNIEPGTLGDVLCMANNDFNRTVDLLREMRCDEQQRTDERMRTHEQDLMERAKIEADKLTVVADQVFAPAAVGEKRVENSEEAKLVALRHFEDCRNLAKHHTQMRTECYQKAKAAIHTGNTEVAVYYSRVANLHKSKVDRCNQHAANCIVEVHNLTNNNPDMLDLHYLYVKEAIECLDLFLDQHISRIRARLQPHKSVMVITGRGLHSSRGYSTVKQNTKFRLRERGLR